MSYGGHGHDGIPHCRFKTRKSKLTPRSTNEQKYDPITRFDTVRRLHSLILFLKGILVLTFPVIRRTLIGGVNPKDYN